MDQVQYIWRQLLCKAQDWSGCNSWHSEHYYQDPYLQLLGLGRNSQFWIPYTSGNISDANGFIKLEIDQQIGCGTLSLSLKFNSYDGNVDVKTAVAKRLAVQIMNPEMIHETKNFWGWGEIVILGSTYGST